MAAASTTHLYPTNKATFVGRVGLEPKPMDYESTALTD